MALALIKMIFGLLWIGFVLVIFVILAPYDFTREAIWAIRHHKKILNTWREYFQEILETTYEMYNFILNIGQQ